MLIDENNRTPAADEGLLPAVDPDSDAYLSMDLLRFTTAGSVDDGERGALALRAALDVSRPVNLPESGAAACGLPGLGESLTGRRSQ